MERSLYRDHIENRLRDFPELEQYLFIRGFVACDTYLDPNGYPFFGKWKYFRIEGFHFYIHPKQTWYYVDSPVSCFLIGHAYDPFTMETDETAILRRMALCTRDVDRIKILNSLTGIFTMGWCEKDRMILVGDCAGMQTTYYGCVKGKIYFSSHMQLIGDICDLEPSDYVKKLTSYRFYHYYGAYLPGDLSSYPSVRRIVPNTLIERKGTDFKIKRFYPEVPLDCCSGEESYREKLAYIADLLHKNMILITQKWNQPAISMSGGMDSKCSLAAANGLYDRFQYFSYISMAGERIDAEAAHTIAEAIHIPHRIDFISSSDEDFPGVDGFRAILQHNFGNIGRNNDNDVRKRVYYTQYGHCTFDVEVKSWVSEIGRANYYKKFGLKHMPERLSPRQMSTMYKLFLHNRSLLKETDAVFEEYINRVHFNDIFNYDASDMFLWEVRYGSWGGQVITSEQRLPFDITIPYNNRLLLEAFLTLPLERRIADQVHADLIHMLNAEIDKTGVSVTNYNETKSRMIKEKVYYLVNSALPF